MKCFLMAVLISLLVPIQVNSESLNCDVDLNVIEDTFSSQYKKLQFNIINIYENTPSMSGEMLTQSCFNNFKESFNSDKVTLLISENNIVVHNPLIWIGRYSYALNMQLEPYPLIENDEIINFKAKGRIIPLNDSSYLHQNIDGNCLVLE